MKKRVIRTIIIIVGSLIVVGILRTAVIYFVNIFSKDYFGDKYIEIIYPTSIGNYITAKQVINEADTAFSTITNVNKPAENLGNLEIYYITDDEAVNEKHDIDFISAKFQENNGYIWVRYYSEAYDKNGEITSGSWNILSRWELEKVDGKWIVTSIIEPP